MGTASFKVHRFARGFRPLRLIPRVTTALRPIALLGLLTATVTAATDGSDWYRITVNSAVEPADSQFSRGVPWREHGRKYTIISLNAVPRFWSIETGAKPPSITKREMEARLGTQLRRALAAQGFYEAEVGTVPDIVLTVSYGRSRMINPYRKKEQIYYQTLATPGGWAKIRQADTAKLFIAVFAWRCPKTAQDKPKQVWRTIIKTDDPDMDLSLQSERMLMAGAAFFDHPTEALETTFSSDLPEGHVKVGLPTVVEPNK
jgi:hypothetical protein